MTFTTEFEDTLTEKLYDLSHLEETLGGSDEFMISLASIYLSTIPCNSRLMLQATYAEDWPTVSNLAHKIKPTIDCMKIISISMDIRTLERDAKCEINTHVLGKIAVRVDHVINKVAHQLKYEYDL